MKQLLEALFKGSLSNLLNKKTNNSHNITGNHIHEIKEENNSYNTIVNNFNGPVTMIQPIARKKLKLKSKPNILSNT